MVNFNLPQFPGSTFLEDIFSSGDPRRQTVTFRGEERPISFLLGLSESAIQSYLRSGELVATPDALNALQEVRASEGRSGTQNFANAFGQDTGFVGETGVGAIERGSRLAGFVASLIPVGKVTLGTKLLPGLGGILSQAKNIRSIGQAKSFLTSSRNLGILGAYGVDTALTANAIAAGITPGDQRPITPAELGVVSPVTEARPEFGRQNTIQPVEGSPDTYQILRPDGSTLAVLAASELRAVKSNPEGERVFLSQYNIPAIPDIPESEEPGTNNIVPMLLNGQPTGLYKIVDDFGTFLRVASAEEIEVLTDPDAPNRRRMIEEFNLNSAKLDNAIAINNAVQSQQAFTLQQAQVQADLAAKFSDPKTAALLRAGIARMPQGSDLSPLLASLTSTRPGDPTLTGTSISGNVAGFFGLQPGQNIPVPGAERTNTRQIRVNEGGGNVSEVTSLPTTQRGREFGLQQIPLNNALMGLTTEEQDLFNTLLAISGTDPAEVERRQQQLAPPGSGRAVFAAFQ